MIKKGQPDIIARIAQLIEANMESKTSFAKRVGVDFSNFAKMMNGETRITDKTMEKISASEGVRFRWLKFGEEPQKEERDTTLATETNQKPTKTNEVGKKIPVFGELPVSGGFIEQTFDLSLQEPTGYLDIAQCRGAEFCFPVIGCSMRPTINEGDYIGVKRICSYETTSPDRVYMLVTRDDERMIKRILDFDPEEGSVVLGSDNPAYPPRTIRADNIVHVYKVVFRMCVETL